MLRRAALVLGLGTLIPACGPDRLFRSGEFVIRGRSFTLLAPTNGAQDVGVAPTFSWTSLETATAYSLQVSTDPLFGSFSVNQSAIPGTSFSPAVTLSMGRTYYWQVYAEFPTGNLLALDAPFSFTTVPPPPGGFTLTTPANGATNVPLTPTYTWTAASSATSYTLQVSTSASFAAFTSTPGIVTTSFTPGSALDVSTTYYWTVLAVDDSGNTVASGGPFSFTTLPLPPGAFTQSSPSAGATGVAVSPTFSWTASNFATTYTLQVSTSPSFTSMVVNQSGIGGTTSSPSVFLDYSTVYYWTVTAVNTAGVTLAGGAPLSFTTGPPPGISIPSTTLSFTAPAAGPNPASQTIQLSNSSGDGSPLHWAATSSAPWLQVTPTGGTTGSTPTPLTVSVTLSQAEAWTTPTTLTNSPEPREDFGMVWTGTRMIVWGGSVGPGNTNTNDGFAYDPVADSWAPISSVGAPTARWGLTAVWTGKQMIVWGGQDSIGYENDGWLYDPLLDSWSGPISSTGAPSGRVGASAVWTGSRMIVWGGTTSISTFFSDGASYDPASDTWTAISSPPTVPDGRWHQSAAWDGSQMLVWGGQDASGVLNNGGQYDPSTDTWGAALSSTGAPAARDAASTVWDGLEMILWGGFPGSAATTTSGGRYAPLTDSWAAMTQTNVPPGVRSHAAVWAGSQMIIWGGYDGGALRHSGMKYQPPVALAPGTYQATVTLTDPRASNSPQTITVTFTVTP